MNNDIQLVDETFVFHNNSLTIKRIKNLDELVDRVSDSEFEEDERLPYWAELWPSAIALSRFIFNNQNLFAAKNILELGCGLGLTSLSLSCQRPAHLLITDYEQSALEMTKQNFLLNRFPIPQTTLLDWRKPNLHQSFNLIVGSDLAYEERFFSPLLDLFHSYLERGGSIILAEPNRAVAMPFFDLLQDSGFVNTVVSEKVLQDNRSITVNIHNVVYKF